MECSASRPSSRSGQVSASEPFCLACAACGQAICTPDAVVQDHAWLILKNAVYAYELSVLGVPAWCYSATGSAGERFDVIRLDEVCVGSAPRSASNLFPGTRRAAGVVVADAQAPPSSVHSWFPGFAYQAVRCSGCSIPRLLGWAYTREDAASKTHAGKDEGFFGLIITRLRERQIKAKTWSPSAAIANGQKWARLRGLTASTVSKTTSCAAAAAARGRGAMPGQLIPSTIANLPAKPVAASSWQETSSGSDTEEVEDFQLQRRVRRCEGRDAALLIASQVPARSARGSSVTSAIGLPIQSECQSSSVVHGTSQACRSGGLGTAKLSRLRKQALPPLNSRSARLNPVR